MPLSKLAKDIKEKLIDTALPYQKYMPTPVKEYLVKGKMEELQKQNLNLLKHFMPYALGSSIASLGLLPLAMPKKDKVTKELFSGKTQNLRHMKGLPKEDTDLIRSFAKRHKINPSMTIDKIPGILKLLTGGAGFSPELGVISESKSAPILLHELGHAADFKNLSTLKTMGRLTGNLGMMGAPLLALNDDLKKYAPAVWLGSLLPTLYQEGKASGSALKHMYDIGKRSGIGGKELLRGFKAMGPAFLTYLLGAALPAYGLHTWAQKD